MLTKDTVYSMGDDANIGFDTSYNNTYTYFQIYIYKSLSVIYRNCFNVKEREEG
jgi:hypothetical protein